MNVHNISVYLYGNDGGTHYFNGFVKFLGVTKTAPNQYEIAYLSDPSSFGDQNYMISMVTSGSYLNIYKDDIDYLEVIGQVIEPLPYGGYPTIEYITAVRQLTPEEHKLKNRVNVINNVLSSAPIENNT